MPDEAVPPPPAYVADIASRLAPFATGTNAAGQVVWTASPADNISTSGCAGSGDCGPYFPVWPGELIGHGARAQLPR